MSQNAPRNVLHWSAPAVAANVNTVQWIPGDASSRAGRQQVLLQWAETLSLPVAVMPEQAAPVHQRPVVGVASDGPISAWFRRTVARRNAVPAAVVEEVVEMGRARVYLPLTDPVTGQFLSKWWISILV